MRRCVRRTEGKLLGGVAGGLADHLGVPAVYVRVAFVVGMVISGFSVLVYAALWVVLPQDTVLANVDQPAGVAAATRRGLRTERAKLRKEDAGQLVAVSVLAIGLIFLLQRLGNVDPRVFWPILVGAVGLALLWRQLDDAQRSRRTSSTRGWRLGGLATLLRAGVGLAFIPEMSAAGVEANVVTRPMDAAPTRRVGIASRNAAGEPEPFQEMIDILTQACTQGLKALRHRADG